MQTAGTFTRTLNSGIHIATHTGSDTQCTDIESSLRTHTNSVVLASSRRTISIVWRVVIIVCMGVIHFLVLLLLVRVLRSNCSGYARGSLGDGGINFVLQLVNDVFNLVLRAGAVGLAIL